MDNFNTLMEFYGDPTPFDPDAVKSLEPKLVQRMDELAELQLTIIDVLRRKGMDDKSIRKLILGPDAFVRQIERIIWSRS